VYVPLIQHRDRPILALERGRIRRLAAPETGATATTVFEQWLPPAGYIPLHYHDVEEVVVLLRGSVQATMGGHQQLARSPATLIIPAGQVHALRPATGSEEVYLLAIFPSPNPQIILAETGQPSFAWDEAQIIMEEGH
jgi:quercetin dioxygenase-like cupin family protein